ncbi:odorant receptor 295 isoform X2 [Nasonia vitripennis]|uniref:Uncharacterized protein n=1 Tax=Nasonia vitripennis TaxID=7425 RepID=A0A7M7Q1E9_NASVI|nr:odorant receptor 295 isoform X2 [Nasonia vitripennis]
MGLIEVLESRKIFLWICGLWPKEYQHKPKLSQMKLYFIWFNMLMMCLLVFAGLVAIATPDNIPQFLTDFIGFAAAASKLIPFVHNRKRMMKVIMETLKLEETSKFENDNDLEIIRSWRRTRDGVLKYHMRIYGFISVAYCFLPIISQVNTYPAQTIIQASLFVSPWYEFFYGFHCAQLFLYLFIIIATDGLSMILIFKLCEELQRFECLLFERHRADDATLSEKYKSREQQFGDGKPNVHNGRNVHRATFHDQLGRRVGVHEELSTGRRSFAKRFLLFHFWGIKKFRASANRADAIEDAETAETFYRHFGRH